MTKIIPCLWFNNQAEDAAQFYAGIFKHAKVGKITRYGDVGPGPKGQAVTVEFELDGQPFVGLNGGPGHPFTDALSFQIMCDDQAEVDYYWSRLTAGGKEVMCSWLVDKYGLSWQVVPKQLPKLLADRDPARAGRAMQAMMKMKKIDIATIERAADGK